MLPEIYNIDCQREITQRERPARRDIEQAELRRAAAPFASRTTAQTDQRRSVASGNEAEELKIVHGSGVFCCADDPGKKS